MKYLLLIFLSVTTISFCKAQGSPPEPAYKRFPTLPPLELLRPDSTLITKSSLKKQQTIIMFFSPDCDHCIHQMDEMSKRLNDLKKFQIVMATYQPMDMLVAFIGKYKLDEHNNFSFGRDVKFTLPGFYAMKSLPYFALYDKKGNLITTYEGNVKVDKLIKSFSKKEE